MKLYQKVFITSVIYLNKCYFLKISRIHKIGHFRIRKLIKVKLDINTRFLVTKDSLFIFLGLTLFYTSFFFFFISISYACFASFSLHAHEIFFQSLSDLHHFYSPCVAHDFSSSVASSVVDLLSVPVHS